MTGAQATRALPRPAASGTSLRTLAGEQVAVSAGQMLSGAGNLVFALVLARLLAPGDFAALAAFLALYLVIHVPASSLAAGGALAPGVAARARRRVLLAGLAVGAAIALATPVLAPLLDLPPALLLLLAASAPGAGLLALERGRLYGLRRHGSAVGSLLAEPLVRLGAGLALAVALGPVAGAAAVVAAGYAALAVARLGTRGRGEPAREAHAARAATQGGLAAALFLLLAVVQNQDVLLAGGLLSDAEAGRFAVLSTVGGIAAFATTTVPLVLMPRAAAGDERALRAALGVAVLLGAGAVLPLLAAPELVGLMFGERYASVGALAAPYVAAMALLGVARVLLAHTVARGSGRSALAVVAPVAVLQAVLIVAIGHDAAGVATATLASTAALTVLAAAAAAAPGGATVIRFPSAARSDARLEPARRALPALAGLTAVGLVLRLLADRGIWLDEAISLEQAKLPFAEMISQLRTVDVHPPLHHVLMWLNVRVFGTSELALRVPSLLAGTALIPLLYAAGRDIWDRRAGLAAAALATLAPFLIWYAQEARMYALFMLLALLAVWTQVRAIRDGHMRDWLLYALASVALVWNQYFALLLVAVQQGAFAAVLWSRRAEREHALRLLRRWAAALALIALALVPLVPFALDQFEANQAAGKGFQQLPSQAGDDVAASEPRPSVYSAITNLAWAVWGYHSDATMKQMAALWPLAMLGALMLLGRGRSWRAGALAAAALVPPLLLFGLGQAKPFVFEVRYFAGAIPALLLLVGRALTSWPRSRLTAGLCLGALMATFALGFADQQLNGTNPRVYDFRGALAEVRSQARPGDVVVYTPDYLDAVVAYYGHDLEARQLTRDLPERGRGGVFVLASFQDKPQFEAAANDAVRRLERERRLVRSTTHPQIRVWEFR